MFRQHLPSLSISSFNWSRSKRKSSSWSSKSYLNLNWCSQIGERYYQKIKLILLSNFLLLAGLLIMLHLHLLPQHYLITLRPCSVILMYETSLQPNRDTIAGPFGNPLSQTTSFILLFISYPIDVLQIASGYGS